MKTYSHYGFNEFVILLGYKGHIIKKYFHDYFLFQNDITFDLVKNNFRVHSTETEPWKVTLVETGRDTQTGGRILQAKKYLNDEPFFLTYGDGVSDVNIHHLHNFHNAQKKLITVTAVQPEGRFGSLSIVNGMVNRFNEKPKGDGSWINGGFFVCEPGVLSFIKEGERTIFENQPLQDLALQNQFCAYKHDGFWKPMDTLRDKVALEDLWTRGNPPWKVWND
jgi:glucose-1-phosphate cytidylyltransferase